MESEKMSNEELKEAEDELLGLLENKVKKLRSQRKYIRVKGHLRPNDGSIDHETGKPIKDDDD